MLHFMKRPKFQARQSLGSSCMPENTKYRVPAFLIPSLNDLSRWTSLGALSPPFKGTEERPVSLICIILSTTAKLHALCREAPKENLNMEGFILNKNS